MLKILICTILSAFCCCHNGVVINDQQLKLINSIVAAPDNIKAECIENGFSLSTSFEKTISIGQCKKDYITFFNRFNKKFIIREVQIKKSSESSIMYVTVCSMDEFPCAEFQFSKTNIGWNILHYIIISELN
jgi:hypothetical protein